MRFCEFSRLGLGLGSGLGLALGLGLGLGLVLRVLLPARERLCHALAGHGHQLGEHGGPALHPCLRLPVLNDLE